MAAAVGVGAVSFTLIKLVLREATPLTLAAGRVGFSALAFVVVVGLQPHRRTRIAPADRWRVLAVGLGGSAVFHGLFAWGQQQVSVAAGSVLLALMPALVALGEVAFRGHRMTRRQLGGLSLCLAGLGVMSWGPGAGTTWWGLAAVAAAVAVWAAVTLLSRDLVERYDPWWLNTPGTVVGAVLLLAVAAGRTDDLGRLSSTGWVELVWLGAVSSAFMYAAIAQAMQVFTATTAATLLTVATPLSVVVAWATLGERPTVAATIGGLVVGAGVVLTIRDERPGGDRRDRPADDRREST